MYAIKSNNEIAGYALRNNKGFDYNAKGLRKHLEIAECRPDRGRMENICGIAESDVLIAQIELKVSGTIAIYSHSTSTMGFCRPQGYSLPNSKSSSLTFTKLCISKLYSSALSCAHRHRQSTTLRHIFSFVLFLIPLM